MYVLLHIHSPSIRWEGGEFKAILGYRMRPCLLRREIQRRPVEPWKRLGKSGFVAAFMEGPDVMVEDWLPLVLFASAVKSSEAELVVSKPSFAQGFRRPRRKLPQLFLGVSRTG